MNPKTRMLLWEECRVGGSIAGLCTAMGLLCLGMARLTAFGSLAGASSESLWHAVDFMVLLFTLGAPMAVAVLLVLSTANSGHLVGGFSRRILTLPVDTSRAVLVALLTRFTVVLLVSAFMVSVCWGLFQHGPGVRAVFLLAGLYLAIQLLDWARAVAALVVPAVVLIAVLAALEYVGGLGDWTGILVAEASVTPVFLLAFALLAAAGCGVAWLLVGQARCGERLALFDLPTRDSLTVLPMRERRRDFASPMAAQVWFELRRGGMLFPLMVFSAWLLMAGLGLMITFRPGRWNEPYHGLVPWFWRHLNTALVFEWIPLLALLAAALAWGVWDLKTRIFGKGRPRTFMLRPCLTKAQMAHARLTAMALSLGGVLVLITLVRINSILWTDDYLIAEMITRGVNAGQVSVREVVIYLLGPSFLAGGLAWLFMAGLAQLRSWMLWLTLGLSTAVVAMGLLPEIDHGGFLCFLGLAAWATVLTVICDLMRRLFATYRKGLIGGGTLLKCLAFWAAVTTFIFPFNAAGAPEKYLLLLLASMAMGAVLVLPFAGMVYALGDRGAREGLMAENPEQHRRTRIQHGFVRRLAPVAGLLLLLAGALWLRWPAEPAYVSANHAQGLPATLDELNAWYKPAPVSENLAVSYLHASRLARRQEARFNTEVNQPVATAANVPAPNPGEAFDNILLAGNAEAPRGKPIPAEVWRWTRKYYDAVAPEVVRELHTAAKSGLTASRYPTDLRMGMNADLRYLAPLRHMARLLGLETLIASVEGRHGAAIQATLDTFPLANSLKEEPLLISQLVRCAIYGIAFDNCQTMMNRAMLSDEELLRLQTTLADAVPSASEELMFRRAMLGEQLMNLDVLEKLAVVGALDFDILWSGNAWLSSPLAAVFPVIQPFIGLSGRAEFERLFVLSRFDQFMMDYQALVSEPYVAAKWDARDKLEEEQVEHLYWQSMLPYFYMPNWRTVQSEWRIRTQFDMTQTAIAVERFRRAQGRLPRQLAELVPAYLDSVPADPWNHGKPLSYRVKDNGEFVVYSYALNGKDDHGEERKDGSWWSNGDMTFTVVPPEVRTQPQVATAPENAIHL